MRYMQEGTAIHVSISLDSPGRAAKLALGWRGTIPGVLRKYGTGACSGGQQRPDVIERSGGRQLDHSIGRDNLFRSCRQHVLPDSRSLVG